MTDNAASIFNLDGYKNHLVKTALMVWMIMAAALSAPGVHAGENQPSGEIPSLIAQERIQEDRSPIRATEVVQKELEQEGERQWFEFSLEEAGQVNLELVNLKLGQSGDLLVNLYKSDGTPVLLGEEDEMVADGQDPWIATSLEQGTYYLEVLGKGNQAQAIPYELVINPRTDGGAIPPGPIPPEADPLEPNDSPENAKPLSMDGPVSGFISFAPDKAADADWFFFDLAQTRTVAVEAWNPGSGAGASALSLSLFGKDETESPLARTQARDPAWLRVRLDPGRYLVKVSDRVESRYQLRLSGFESQYKRVREARMDGRVQYLYAGAAGPPAFGDIDGDGDPDMLLGAVHGKIRYYRNDGTPGFPAFTLVSERFADIDQGRWSRIVPALADIDADGDLDLFLAQNSRILFYQNSGTARNGGWSLQSESYAGIDGKDIRFSAIRFKDIDADGDSDLLLSGSDPRTPGSWEIFCYRNTGTAQQAQWAKQPFPGALSRLAESHFDLFDSDKDGDPDLFCHGSDGILRHYENQGDRQNPDWRKPPEPILETGHGPAHPFFIDMNDDGRVDLWLENRFYKNQGGLDFVSSQAGGYTEPFAFWWYSLGDLDGDGDPDLLAEDRADGKPLLCYYRNQGTPATASWEFAGELLAGFGADPEWLVPELGDVDGDGDPDLLLGVGRPDWGKLYWFANQGEPGEPRWDPENPRFILETERGPVVPRLGDLDGDGDLDLLVSTLGETLALYANQGTPRQPDWKLQNPSYLSGCGRWAVPCLHDIDGDKDLDLLVGNDSGAARVYENISGASLGEAAEFDLKTRVYSGIRSPYPGAVPGFADMDADGDADLFWGTSGGLLFYRNSQAHLAIAPLTRTLRSEQRLSFRVSEGKAPIQWALVANRSGGRIDADSGEYQAGAVRQSRIDTVEAIDADGLSGRAFVNVLPEAEVSGLGRAVIVAGKRASDHVWAATRYMAEFAYQSLRYRGLAPEDIRYLSADPELENADGPATAENLHWGLSDFARGADGLTLFLVDHGETDAQGTPGFRLNPDEVLSANTLDGWLDALQAEDIRVTVVLDCCYAGAFLPYLKPPEGRERISIASTGPQSPTYYIADGLISFSGAFFSAIHAGENLFSAFESAAQAMSRFQSPMLDDNGDGLYQPAEDGELAQTVSLGPARLTAADQPRIGRTVGNLDLGNGEPVEVWAEDLSGPYPITEVWAVVIPPNFSPDPDAPVAGLPRIDLRYNPDTRRYEGGVSQAEFDRSGVYSLVFFARDIWNAISPAKQIRAVQGGAEKVVVIDGSGAYPDPEPRAAAAYLADYAHQTLTDRWLSETDIHRLGTENTRSGASRSLPDAAPTWENLSQAITQWAAEARTLSLIFVGKGDGQGLYLNPSEQIAPAQLDDLLDAYQSRHQAQINLILDGSDSDSWIAELSGPNRLMIVSGSGQAPREAGGRLAFTQFFMNHVFLGKNLRQAFLSAGEATRFLLGPGREHLLEDNGNGLPNEKSSDGELAGQTHLGGQFVTGGDLPRIGAISPNQMVKSDTALIWAKDLADANGIARVQAVIRPPDEATPSVNLALDHDPETDRYQARYHGFDQSGPYTVLIFAQDREGQTSDPRRAVFTRTRPHASAQGAMPEAEVGIPQSGGTQYRFESPGQAHWVKFYAIAGRTYVIQADELGPDSDPVLALFDTDGQTRLDYQDTPLDPDSPESLTWTAPQDGVYFIKVSHYDPETFGQGTDFRLRIYQPVAGFACFLSGRVKDSDNGQPIAGAAIKTSANGSALSQEDGAYLMAHPAGTFDLTVTAEGYAQKSHADIVLEEGESKTLDLELQAADPVAPSDPPALLWPENGQSETPLTPTLQAEPIPGRTHGLSRWQVATDKDFSRLVLDIGNDQDLLALTIPELILETGTDYLWRVRFTDNSGEPSLWSAPYSFTTVSVDAADTDGNGVPDDQQVDGAGDLDQNGIADSRQSDIRAVHAISGDQQIGVKSLAPGGDITGLRALSQAAIAQAPPSGALPFGLISFRLTVPEGATVQARIYLSQPLDPGAKWYKYDLSDGWRDYSEDTTIAADRRALDIGLTDGGFGDADGVANGVIVDPCGPVVDWEPSVPEPDLDDAGGGCFIRDMAPWADADIRNRDIE